MITYPLDLIPFSLCGSFLTISSRNSSGSPRLIYKTTSSRNYYTHNLPFLPEEFFELALIKKNQEVPYTWQAYPHKLEIYGEGGETLTLVFSDENTLLFNAENTGVILIPCKVFSVQYSPAINQICLIDWFARGIHMFRADDHTNVETTISESTAGIDKYRGEFPYAITFKPKDDTSTIRGGIHFSRYETFWDKSFHDFDTILSIREEEYVRWMSKLPGVPETYQIPAELAWFVLWNCQVPPEAALSRPAIYMSKNWMNGIWAWDNLFNALAIVKAKPQLAWDQIMLFFDNQDPNGMVPDMITDLEPIYGFTKPPLYGWAICKLVDELGVKKSLPYLNSIYKPLKKLTNWWYTFRDYDQDGLPQYNHGNDSGWDNATIFDHGCPVEGADLAAYLVLQCDCLAFICEVTGRKKAAIRWKAKAEKQLSDLLTHSVKDDHLFSPLSGNHQIETSQSLINYLPLLLGKRLPKRIRKTLVADLQSGGPLLSPYGLASESPSSSKYLPDGYWRGPIWAASSYLICDGLIRAGEQEMARLIAERFCDLCLLEPGFWENYDALTGKGLRCPGYSWTASVFLLFAEWLKLNTTEK